MSAYIGFAREQNQHPIDLPGFSFAWLEGTEAVCLTHIQDVPDWKNFKIWLSGRLFSDAGEYQWRYQNGKLRTVLLLDNQILPPPFTGNQILLQQKGIDAYLILWGEWVDPGSDPDSNPDGSARFYAPEIPRVQSYPIETEPARQKGKTPRLRIRRYYHETLGEFLRCVGFDMRGEEKTQGESHE